MAESVARLEVRFSKSKTRQTVELGGLREKIVDFLEYYCREPLVGQEFLLAVKGADGPSRFSSLLDACGKKDDPHGFFAELVRELETANAREPKPVKIGGFELPYRLLLAALELLLPGGGFKSIKKISQLEALGNFEVPKEESRSIQEVLDTYPVRISMHALRQSRLSRAVAMQFLPFVGELDTSGDVHTWVGQFHRGITEQMYRNRVILIMNMACPVYCRFCFRKHKECRTQKAPTKQHVRMDLAYLAQAPDVTEVVLTGGDPFMNKATLGFAVDELAKIPHIKTLRLATRSVSYYPEMFTADGSYWKNYLLRKSRELRQKGKRLELATHFVHPDEVSIESLDIISELSGRGVPVYVQTPFVSECNDGGPELVELFSLLRSAGAELHYIFMPTSPIRGNRVYWSPISRGLQAARYLRAHLSDRAVPHITTATSIGKMDWNTSGWVVEADKKRPGCIWLRTPYTLEYFEAFAPIRQFTDTVRENAEGTLDASFRAELGDERLIAGPRGLTSSPQAYEVKLTRTRELAQSSLDALQLRLLEDQRRPLSIVTAPGIPALRRQHETRVELDVGASEVEVDAALEQLGSIPAVTDVVLSKKDDITASFSRTADIVERLRRISHITAVRLRSFSFNRRPAAFTGALITRLTGLNRLEAGRPLRVELETCFLHSSEFQPVHEALASELSQRGVTVYANAPLLGYINDNEGEMLRVAHACRSAGIEFTNVYVSGLPIQGEWNRQYPIELNSVIDIASHIRKLGSGREVPRYLVGTELGEVDFAIAPRIFQQDAGGRVLVHLLPHRLEHFSAMDPEFEWPDGVDEDVDGHPRIPVEGISLENQEFLFRPLKRGARLKVQA